jgi:hypothetical protein
VSNRWVRFLLAVVALAAAAAAAYRVIEDEQRLARDGATTRAAEQASETALITLVDLKATLHAYVAPGQGFAFWATRAVMQIDKLRGAILELDPAATASGAPLAQALDTCDRLAAAEQRARDHVRAGQALLAGDVIFTEVRDLLDGLRIQLAHARDQIAIATGDRVTQARREQTWVLAGGAGALALVMLLLGPVPARAAPATAAGEVAAPDRRDSLSLAQGRADAALALDTVVPPLTAGGSPASTPDLAAAAAICADLARVADSTEISGLLARAATVLHASGIIVWVSGQDGLELFPVASTGYDERVFARIGSIGRDASNLTAASFRDALTRVSSATATSGSALAIPLAGPQGPVGVLSAECPAGAPTLDPSRVAVAEIFAAQLATLIGSLPASSSTPHIAQA